MKRNALETPEARAILGGQTTDRFINGVATASHATLLLEAGRSEYPLTQLIYNCEYSTVSATIIWLQERGCIIPADILASLGIEGAI